VSEHNCAFTISFGLCMFVHVCASSAGKVVVRKNNESTSSLCNVCVVVDDSMLMLCSVNELFILEQQIEGP
jgi:hypothetical protein